MSDTGDEKQETPLERFEWNLKFAVTQVEKELGFGLSEAIYRNALAIELRALNTSTSVSPEVHIPVTFLKEVIGTLRADLVVRHLPEDGAKTDAVRIIELKVAAKITDAHVAQAKAYLDRSPKGSTAYVINFAPGGVELRALVAGGRKRKADDLDE